MLSRGSRLLQATLLALGVCLVSTASQPLSPTAPFSVPSSASDEASTALSTPAPSSDSGGSPKPSFGSTSPSPSPTEPFPATLSPSLSPSSSVYPTVTVAQGTPAGSQPKRTHGAIAGDSGWQGPPGRQGLEMVVLVEHVERRERPAEPQRTGGAHAMVLFLAACGLLLCLFAGIYCAYRRAAKGSPFAHQRLQDGLFDDLALYLDSPKGSYDWFFYDTEEDKFPALQKPGHAPPWPYPPIQPPPARASAPQTSPGNSAPQPPCSEQPKPSPPRLECLSPANLPTSNFL